MKYNMPTDCGWRHFRYFDGKKWIKVKKQIRSEKQLNKILPDIPVDLYYSITCFLEPYTLGKKSKKDIILKSDLAIDVDGDFSIEGLEKAQKVAIKTLKYMKTQKDYKLRYIAFSGGKGFHIVYDDLSPIHIHPYMRIDDITKRRRRLIELLPKGIDKEITADVYRVIRLPGSVNTKTGYICSLISEEQLRIPIRELLKHIPNINRERPAIAQKADEENLPADTGWNERTGSSSPPLYFSTKVSGIKNRWIFALKYQKDIDYEYDLKKLIEKYNLTDVFIFESTKYFFGISLKTFQRGRLNKINNSSKGRVAQIVPIRIGYIKTLKTIVKPTYISKPHLKYLEIMLKDVPEYKNKHGDLKLKIGVG